MKKTIALIMVLLLSVLTVACEKRIENKETTTFENNQSASVDASAYSKVNSQNEYDKLKKTDTLDSGGGELTLQKYRSIYYSIPSPFWDVIDENSREDIYGKYWEEPYDEINTMRMKIFVEEYNIPREKFDAANAEWARIVKEKLYGTPVINPQDYANQEFDEVYNADIIYTFDDEIINEYYLSHDYPYCYESEYESAVENDFYVTQTAEIIDIADLKEELAFFNQLKAEKSLLESEIVTGATENVTAESTAEASEAETENTTENPSEIPSSEVHTTA